VKSRRNDLVVLGRERRATGLLERDPAALRESADVFERLGHRFEVALVRTEVAEQLLAHGETPAASVLFEESLATYDDVGALHEADRVRARLARLSPSRQSRAPRRAVSGWDALTPTEREVVDEVCGGRSNGQVADRLGISRRTVEAHLRSIYAKLGVSTRLALAVAYRERAPVG
jgi:DNA-binding CsgD family transcriptional regulator